MSVGTDAILFYGWPFDEDYEFPWSNAEDDGDQDYTWWKKINGYQAPSSDDRKERNAHWKEWLKEHPIPWELETYCSYTCPMYALAVPGTITTAFRGDAIAIHPEDLRVPEDATRRLREVIEKYGLEPLAGPGWFLVSLWGE